MLEYSDYYDFTSSYHPNPAIPDDDNDSNWSDDPDSDTTSIASDDLRPVQLEHELRLPHSGKRLGHRSLARYYRQNLRPERVVTAGEQTHRLMIEGPQGSGGRAVVGVRRLGERSMMVDGSKRRFAERESRRFRDQREREQFRIGVAFRKTAEFKKYFRGMCVLEGVGLMGRSASAVRGMLVLCWGGGGSGLLGGLVLGLVAEFDKVGLL
jgi:hypothetical protein